MAKLGVILEPLEVKALFDALDVDRSGEIEYDEIQRAMHGHLPRRGVDSHAPATLDQYLLTSEAAGKVRMRVLEQASMVVAGSKSQSAMEWWDGLLEEEQVRATLGNLVQGGSGKVFYQSRSHIEEDHGELAELLPGLDFATEGKGKLIKRLEEGCIDYWGAAIDVYFGRPEPLAMHQAGIEDDRQVAHGWRPW